MIIIPLSSNKCTSFDLHYCCRIISSIYYRTVHTCLKSTALDGKSPLATITASDCGTYRPFICAAVDLNRCIFIRTGKADEYITYTVTVSLLFSRIFHSHVVSTIDRHMAFDHFDQHILDTCGHATGNVDDHVLAILNIYRDRSGILAALHCIRTALGDFFSCKRQGFLRLRTYAIAILRFCARLRRECAHRQNRQHHARRKRCTEKSRTLFSHCLSLTLFVVRVPPPKAWHLIFIIPPPPIWLQ